MKRIYEGIQRIGAQGLSANTIPNNPTSAASIPERVQVHLSATACALSGALTIRTVGELGSVFEEIKGRRITLDLEGLDRLDTSGAYAIAKLRAQASESGGDVTVTGAQKDHLALLSRVEQALPKPDKPSAPERGLTHLLELLGRGVFGAARFLIELLAMLGIFMARLAWLVRHPSEFRLTALVHHCDQVGWRAIPIVALMSFLIGVVLAFQGSVQLRQFGAEIFVVDLIAISILRELGILLTAIIVAGRTASSFTAAIGSMKMREEIDAMRTLAIDPATVLFVPRILALLITLPILGMIANAMGLFGGAMMAWIELGISPGMFLIRLLEDTSVDHVFVGFVKAPVFALIIGIVGCHAGMGVGGDAESLGRQTSAAVVRAIFAVILADALFSVFFALMEI